MKCIETGWYRQCSMNHMNNSIHLYYNTVDSRYYKDLCYWCSQRMQGYRVGYRTHWIKYTPVCILYRNRCYWGSRLYRLVGRLCILRIGLCRDRGCIRDIRLGFGIVCSLGGMGCSSLWNPRLKFRIRLVYNSRMNSLYSSRYSGYRPSIPKNS